jgi:hypothetical protein
MECRVFSCGSAVATKSGKNRAKGTRQSWNAGFSAVATLATLWLQLWQRCGNEKWENKFDIFFLGNFWGKFEGPSEASKARNDENKTTK